jgi:ABC-type bacteriocin/lantibiotic exporter with double-glycine peptidase domain
MPDNLPVPLHRQQSEGDCLPVCVQMVLDYWGQPADRDDLIAQLGTDPDVGTPGSRVRQLRLRGLTVIYRPVTELDLQQWLAQRIPVILLVDTAQLPYWSRRAAHAVVLVGLDGSTAYVNDPAFAISPLALSFNDLLLASDAMGNLAAVVALRR